MNYLEKDVFAEKIGSGFRDLIANTTYAPSENRLLLDEAIARLSFPIDPSAWDPTISAEAVSQLVYELTFKMECEAAVKYPGLRTDGEAPDNAAYAARVFAKRIFEGHPTYDPFIGTRTAQGERYELNMNLVFSTADIGVNGVRKPMFIYSVSTCAWKIPLRFMNSIRNLFGFSTKRGKLEQRVFDRYIERYHTGSDHLPQD